MNTLHGRAGPLRTLHDALAAAGQGRGQLALISGEAGIGKSALASAFAAEAEAAGVAVTWGRAWEFADAPPYFPVWPCLRALDIELPGRGERRDEEHAFLLWETVLGSLAAAKQPLVWIVEDVHAADLGTIDLLTFLVQPLRATRALIVATMRAQDPHLTDRKLQRLTRIARDGIEIGLQPLGEADIALVAEQTIGRTLPPSAVHHLAELTGGNPLFVVECARASSRSGGLEGAVASLPPTVRQVVLDRVALLPDAARDALASGAVIGREFAAATVARMHESDPVHIIDTLLPALRAGILRETRPGQLAFSHALVCDAIYDAISEAERVRLHQRADGALAALGDGADVLVERARHAIAAAPCGETDHALALARRASELLEREGAYDRALSLHLRIDEARRSGFLPPATRAETLHLARIARDAGRADMARRACDEVLASARLAGDAAMFARAALEHAADVRVAVIDPRQIAILEEAHRMLGDGEPTLACRVLARLSTALQPADDPAVPTDMAIEALRLARATGSDAAVLDVLELAGLGAYFAPTPDKVAWAEELRERALRANDFAKALTAWMWLAYWHADSGDLSAFDRDVTNALELSARAGHPRFRWGPLLMASGRARTHGRFEESDRYVTEVSQIAALIDHPALPLSLVTHEVFGARLLREPVAIRSAIAKLDGVIDGVKRKEEFVAVLRAGCWAHLEDVEATRAELVSIDIETATRDLDPVRLTMLGQACALAGSDAERRLIRARLREIETKELYGAGLSFTYEGPIARIVGLLDAALGDLAGAEDKLRHALERARARRQLPWVAQLAHELARVLSRAGRGDEARALTEEQVAIARELAMEALAGSETTSGRDTSPLSLERAGDVWTITHGERRARVKHSRGMHLLARLAERPGEEIHVLALTTDRGPPPPDSHAGEQLDERARTAYRARLARIEADREDAEAAGDADAVERLIEEKQALARELARAVGLGGRARVAGSATERARINVQRRLKAAITAVAEVDTELGQILEHSLHTGTYCCFRP